MEYISKYEKKIVLNDIKKFDLDYFIYLFVLIDIEKKTKILEKINFDIYFIKETNRLLIKNLSDLDILLDRKKLIYNLVYLLKNNIDKNQIDNNKEWYLFVSLYLNMFYKALITYYKKNNLINNNNTYILKLWLYIINVLYGQLISSLNENSFSTNIKSES